VVGDLRRLPVRQGRGRFRPRLTTSLPDHRRSAATRDPERRRKA
jgi:hypothetical protein